MGREEKDGRGRCVATWLRRYWCGLLRLRACCIEALQLSRSMRRRMRSIVGRKVPRQAIMTLSPWDWH